MQNDKKQNKKISDRTNNQPYQSAAQICKAKLHHLAAFTSFSST